MDCISPNSIGKFVCGQMNIERPRYKQWWMTYAADIDRAIREARNSAIAGIKEEWLSEY